MTETETEFQFIDGCVRTYVEMRFYLKLHPCPRCGERDPGEVRGHDGMHLFDDGSEHYAEWNRAVCGRCGHERKIHVLAEEGAEQRHSDYVREVEERYNFDPYNPRDVHIEVWRMHRQLAAPPRPSTIIQPHEFATELVRLETVRPPDRTTLDSASWGRATSEVFDALTCVYELRKYFAEGRDEMPDEHLGGAASVAARKAHPEWFRRSWVETQAVHWEALDATIFEEGAYRASLPAEDPRSHDYKGE